MNTDDELLLALAAKDPVRGAARVTPPSTVLQSIVSESPTAGSLGFRRLRFVAISAPALALAVIGVVVGTSLLRPASAFATWTVEPGAVDPAFAAAMQRNCALGPTGAEPSLSPETRAEMAEQQVFAQLPVVAMDQRGRAGVALFAERRADGQASVMCMTIAAEVGGPPVVGGGGWGSGAQEAPPDGPLRLFTGQRNGSDAGTFTAYAGSVGPEVTRVTVERSEGSEVVATVSNGYFLVWWPGEAFATSFVGENAEGAGVAEIGNNGWDFAPAGE